MEVMNPQIVPKLPVKPNSSPVKKVKNVFHLNGYVTMNRIVVVHHLGKWMCLTKIPLDVVAMLLVRATISCAKTA
jgi:hypothetical protein